MRDVVHFVRVLVLCATDSFDFTLEKAVASERRSLGSDGLLREKPMGEIRGVDL